MQRQILIDRLSSLNPKLINVLNLAKSLYDEFKIKKYSNNYFKLLASDEDSLHFTSKDKHSTIGFSKTDNNLYLSLSHKQNPRSKPKRGLLLLLDY